MTHAQLHTRGVEGREVIIKGRRSDLDQDVPSISGKPADQLQAAMQKDRLLRGPAGLQEFLCSNLFN